MTIDLTKIAAIAEEHNAGAGDAALDFRVAEETITAANERAELALDEAYADFEPYRVAFQHHKDKLNSRVWLIEEQRKRTIKDARDLHDEQCRKSISHSWAMMGKVLSSVFEAGDKEAKSEEK